jgi:hypothetical protein
MGEIQAPILPTRDSFNAINFNFIVLACNKTSKVLRITFYWAIYFCLSKATWQMKTTGVNRKTSMKRILKKMCLRMWTEKVQQHRDLF